MKVSDVRRSGEFYRHALAPLGIETVFASETAAGFETGKVIGGDGNPRIEFLIEAGTPTLPRLHIAFRAASKEQVNAFHANALAAGGKDNGAPGFRPDYHSGYYAAFVLDPDGHNIEAVWHGS